MAATWNPSVTVQRNFRGFIAVLTSAASEWFLIILLLIDGVLSYLLTKYARYCGLQTPCLLCSRLDPVLGKEKHQFYWSLFCGNHRSEISSLISCNMHGKLADGRAICEDCLLSFTTKENSGPETHGPLFAKLGLDYGNFGSRPFLRRDFVPRSFGTGLCSCCKKPLMSRQKARRLLYKSPVGRATKPMIPLPRVPSHGRLHRRDGLRKMKDRFTDSLAHNHFSKSGSEPLPHVGYSELKITSDSDHELLFFDEDDRKSINDSSTIKDEFPVQYPTKSKSKALSDDLASTKLGQQSLDPGHSLLDMNFELDGDVKYVPSDAVIGHSSDDINSREQTEMSNTNFSSELFTRNDTCPSSGISLDPLGVLVRDYKAELAVRRNSKSPSYKPELPVRMNSKSPSFTDLLSVDIPLPSFGTTSEKLIFRDKMNTRAPSITEEVEVSNKSAIIDSNADHAETSSDYSPPLSAISTFVLDSPVKTEQREKCDSVESSSAPSASSVVQESTVNGEGREESGSPITESTPSLKHVVPSGVSEPIVSADRRKVSDSIAEQPKNENPDRSGEIHSLSVSENSSTHENLTSLNKSNPRVAGNNDEIHMADPTNSHGINRLQRSLSLDRSESGLDSLDGSIISENEGETTVDRLKRQAQYDQKRISALYKELEEERNASAVAANQAMAMITRLQEEKAQLHMEALQYLRMMEEQAEHDVAALEKANDLLAEKEKEIQDLEAELEFYRYNMPDESVIESMPTGGYNLKEENMDLGNASAPISSNSVNHPDKQMGAGTSEGIVDWFEEEKTYISQCLKSLEMQLHRVPHDKAIPKMPDSEHAEKSTNGGQDRKGFAKGDSSRLESQLKENGLSRQENEPTYSGRNGAQEASVGDDSVEHKEDNNEEPDHQKKSISHRDYNICGLENEISDLNERLESLEAVHGFIEHTLNSLQNRDAGLQFVQEIARRLQELQNMGIRIRGQSVP